MSSIGRLSKLSNRSFYLTFGVVNSCSKFAISGKDNERICRGPICKKITNSLQHLKPKNSTYKTVYRPIWFGYITELTLSFQLIIGIVRKTDEELRRVTQGCPTLNGRRCRRINYSAQHMTSSETLRRNIIPRSAIVTSTTFC